MGRRWIFLPALAGKPWNGNTVLDQPLGGSESAVAYLAQSLQRKGEDCQVCTHGDPVKDYTGVIYRGQDYDNVIKEPWDVVVSSRWPEVLDAPWQTKTRLLWLHDMPSKPFGANCEAAVFVSDYQRRSYGVEGEGYEVIGNGVDDTVLYKSLPQRNENKLIWASNPDRGLFIAAHIFQEARKRWPDLELHVYGRAAVYGWDAGAEAPYMPAYDERENIFLHEPVSRSVLFSQMSNAWALFYPTYWPETYCMTALESQYVGTPVIASPYGALNETVKGGVLSWDVLNAISQLRNKRRWDKLSVTGIEWAKQNTWDCQADKWLELVNEVEHRF